MKVREVATESELRALGSSIRIAILQAVTQDTRKEWYAWEIADVVRVPQVNVYYHLKRLVDAGFLIPTLDRVVNGIEEKTYRAAYSEIRFQLKAIGRPIRVGNGKSAKSAAVRKSRTP